MKKFLVTIIIVLSLVSCKQTAPVNLIQSKPKIVNSKDLKKATILLIDSKYFQESERGIADRSLTPSKEFMKEVNLYDEMINFFSPDNFNCNCNDKFKKAFRSSRINGTNKLGFIPDPVQNIIHSDSAILLEQSGSCILAHLFKYRKAKGNISEPIYANDSPTAKEFNQFDFIEKDPQTFDNFLYTLDCSGYLSAAISASAGKDINSIKSSASAAATANKSLIVIGGVMYSPLYQAFKGEGIFNSNNDTIKMLRSNVLKSILKKIPDMEANDTIYLDSNYRVIVASNSGNDSFNGKGSLKADGNARLSIVHFDVHGEIKGEVARKSAFTEYKTYILQMNVFSEPIKITVDSIDKLIALLENNSKTQVK
jgi:hypothetical protein